MQYQVVEANGRRIVECLPGEQLAREADALDLVAACGEHETDLLLLPEGSLHENFYNLRTGLAGAALLKFSMYRIRSAAVVAPERASAGRFGEFVLETNRGSAFRVFSERDSAIGWLAGQAEPRA